MAKNKTLEKFFNKYFSNWTTAKAASKGNITVTSVGDVVGAGNVDPKYGFLMSSIGFMFSNFDDGTFEESDGRFVYGINISTLPGMSESVPSLLIPDWFFINSGTGVVDFCKDLDVNYIETMEELEDIFTPDEGDAIQKRARESSMYD